MEGSDTDGGIYPRGFSPTNDWPWPLVKAGNLVALNYGKALRDPDRTHGDIPVYGTNGRCGWHDQPLTKGPGVILGRKGQGPLGVEWCDADFWVIDTAYYVLANNDRIDLRYFYYLVKYIGLNHLKDGTSNPGLSRSTFADLLLPLPPPQIQRRIAQILQTYDDKIELTRKMNETLVTMARALFKSWFVDFDPVRAKAEGRDLGLPANIAALFPDSFEDSELGEIPTGWHVSSVGDIAEVIDCLHSKKPERRASGKLFLQLGNIREDALLDLTDTYLINEENYLQWVSRMEASEGDCIITNVGRVGAVAQIPAGIKAALGRNMTGMRARNCFPFPTFLVQALTSDAMRYEIELRKDSGTILDALNVRNIPKLRVVVPTKPLLHLFEKLGRPMRARMEQAQKESSSLAALRDVLLPKLISGELRIAPANGSPRERA